jgi:type VI secretion system protein ImpB
VSIQQDLPRSRLTLTYKTTINGEPETVNLPFRLMLLGDFSAGQPKEGEKDLDSRQLRSIKGTNLTSVMSDMNITLTLKDVPNRIEGEENMEVQLPLTSMRSFSPDEIVKNVPQLKSLLLMRQLLQELQGQIDNQSGLRKEIQKLFSDKSNLEALKKELASFAALTLPPKKPAAEETKSLTAGQP